MKSCLDYAMDYIYRFPKTEKELRIQLIKKWYYADEADATLEELKSRGYVDDTMFAKLYIQSELINKGKPSLLVTQKLLFKGIPKDIIKKVIAENEEDVLQGTQERIRKEIDKLKKQELEWVEIIQKLLKKGYKLDEIKSCLKK